MEESCSETVHRAHRSTTGGEGVYVCSTACCCAHLISVVLLLVDARAVESDDARLARGDEVRLILDLHRAREHL